MSEIVKRKFVCDACGATSLPWNHGDLDLEATLDPEVEPHDLPPGWMALQVRQRVPNPEYAPPVTTQEILNEMTANVPGGPEQKAAMMAIFAPLADAQAERQQAQPETIVADIILHFCPDDIGAVRALDPEAFGGEQ